MTIGDSIFPLQIKFPDTTQQSWSLADRRILLVRAGAPSQSELDSEVASLEHMRFDKSQK